MPLKHAQALVFSLKHGFLGLTPITSDNTALRMSHFKPRLQTVTYFQRNACFLSHKMILRLVTTALKNPSPDIISKPRRFSFFELLSAPCLLSRATGGLILILTKLPLLGLR